MRQRQTRPFQSTFSEAPLEDQLPAPSRVLVDGLWEKFGEAGSPFGAMPTPGVSISERALILAAQQMGREEVLNFLTDLAKATPTV
jgi:hypothetical protein